MKKIILVIFCILGIVNLDAKEIDNSVYNDKQIEFYCNNELYNFNSYIEISDGIVLDDLDKKVYLDGPLDLDYDKDNLLYNNKRMECRELSFEEILGLENKIVDVVEEKKNSKDNSINILKYNTYKSLRKGFILNNDKYSDETIYYIKDGEEFIKLNNKDIDLDKINEYYVLKGFKIVSSLKKDENKKYYEGISDNEFVLSTSELSKENALSIYEEVEKYMFDKKEFVIKEEDINNINEKYLTEENSYLDYVVINDNLYYKVTTLDNDGNEISSKYYDVKGNELFEEYELKEIIYYKEYYIVKLLNDNKYIIYDKDKNIINEYTLDKKYELNNIDIGYNKVFLSFVDNESNEGKTILIEKHYEVNYSKYIIVFGSIVFIILVSAFVIKKK